MGSTQNNPKKTTRKKKKTTARGDWGGYVDCPMGKAEKTGFKAWLKDLKIAPVDLMLELVDAEVNFSLAWSAKDDAYLAKATQLSPDDNRRYMLSAFHGDLETAIMLLCFKHSVLLAGNWFEGSVDDEEDGAWG